MGELSIELPEDLAAPSLEVALGLGVFRSELIRQALGHEIAQARGVVRTTRHGRGLAGHGRGPRVPPFREWPRFGPRRAIAKGAERLVEGLIGGGIYLTRLDPAKGAEIGKLRPIALLSAPERLGADSPAVVHLPPEQPIRALLRIPCMWPCCRTATSRSRASPCRALPCHQP